MRGGGGGVDVPRSTKIPHVAHEIIQFDVAIFGSSFFNGFEQK